MHGLRFRVLGMTKRRKPLLRLGFQRFLSSDIFDYFALMSDFGESLENHLTAMSREFESHTLRHRACNFRIAGSFFALKSRNKIQRATHSRNHRIRRIELGIVVQVSINICCCTEIRVTEPLLNLLHRHTVL